MDKQAQDFCNERYLKEGVVGIQMGTGRMSFGTGRNDRRAVDRSDEVALDRILYGPGDGWNHSDLIPSRACHSVYNSSSQCHDRMSLRLVAKSCVTFNTMTGVLENCQ